MTDSFDEFVVTRSTRLLRSAYLLTSDWAAAEDLVQTALVKAWSAWGRIEGDPEPYVRRIMINTQASWWRRRWHREVPAAQLPDRPEAPQTGRADDREQLWQALRQLPVRQRTVLVLRYYENLSDIEIADAMSCSVGTVKSQASRALAKLRIDESLSAEEALP